MSLKDYRSKAAETPVIDEDEFWANIKEERIYSIRNKISLFGDKTLLWNLNDFTKDQSLIHSKPSHRYLERQRHKYAMEGIQTPSLLLGQPRASFAGHAEDGNLASINYMHSGSSKEW